MEHVDDKVARDIETAVAIARIEVKLDTLCSFLDTNERRLIHFEERLARVERHKVWGSGWVAGVAFVVSALVTFIQRTFW